MRPDCDNRMYTQYTLRKEYLDRNDGYADQAAIELARDLMNSANLLKFKAAYSRENAIIAAQEMFPEAAEMDWEKEV
jgi:hypothetical protein